MAANRGWYLSSVKYAAVPAWTANGTSAVGDLIRATAPATGDAHVFRCTVAGTRGSTQPSWILTTIGTSVTSDNTVSWTLVTGLATYGWATAAGHSSALNGGATAAIALGAGDTVYIDSTHAQTQTTGLLLPNPGGPALGTPVHWVSVNAAGSVPPVAADYLPGASFAVTSGSITICSSGHGAYFGCTFSVSTLIALGTSSYYPLFLRDCVLYLNNATTTGRITLAGPNRVTWDNVRTRFGNALQSITWSAFCPLDWRNTGQAVYGNTPNKLFLPTSTISATVTMRGVDLGGMSGAVVDASVGLANIELFQCKLAAGTSATGGVIPVATTPGAFVDFVDCDSAATSVRSERWLPAGNLTTSTTYTRVGGASAFGQGYAHRMATVVNAGRAAPVPSFPMYVPYSAAGSPVTVTVELLSVEGPPTLNPADTTATLSNGNLTALCPTAAVALARPPTFIASGKWFWSIKVDTATVPANYNCGLSNLTHPAGTTLSTTVGSVSYLGGSGSVLGCSATGAATSPGSYATGDVIDFAVDFDNQMLWVRKNGGNWNNSATGSPTSNVDGYSIALLLNGGPAAPSWNSSIANEQATFNFGASAFTYAAPSGFTALNSYDTSLKTTDIALDVDYVNGASTPDGRVATNEPVPGLLAVPVAVTASSATWNGALAGGVARKLAVNITPQLAGVLRAQVRLIGVARTVYVDPQPTVA